MLEVTAKELLEQYDGFLLDAYGVLVDSDRTLPGAEAFLQELRRRDKAWCLISNDGSTTPEAKSERWAGRGLKVEPERLITPWSVLASDLSPLSLQGKRCRLIGTPLSAEMLRRAGGLLIEDESEEPLEVFLLADELSQDFLPSCDRALSHLVRTFESGAEPALVLVNPDLVYPGGPGYGFTAGAIALMFEAALQRVLGRAVSFLRVGKPGPGLFELGLKQLNLAAERVVMLGDQLDTDIAGAEAAGVPSVLVGTGLTAPERAGPRQRVLLRFE